MYIIGLDLSINYSSYTITKDFEKFWFGSIINDPSLSFKSQSNLITLTQQLSDFDLSFTKRVCSKHVKKIDYIDSEREKLVNFIEVTSLLQKNINQIVGNITNTDIIIGIEGFSYGSKGNATFDIPSISGIIKKELLINILHSDINRLFIFSPSDLKKSFDCKGNAGKYEILSKFIDDPIIEHVKNTDFYNYVKDNKFNIYRIDNKGKYIINSPFNDIIDGYLSVSKIYSKLKK